jgi:hypothetical protein
VNDDLIERNSSASGRYDNGILDEDIADILGVADYVSYLGAS